MNSPDLTGSNEVLYKSFSTTESPFTHSFKKKKKQRVNYAVRLIPTEMSGNVLWLELPQ